MVTGMDTTMAIAMGIIMGIVLAIVLAIMQASVMLITGQRPIPTDPCLPIMPIKTGPRG